MRILRPERSGALRDFPSRNVRRHQANEGKEFKYENDPLPASSGVIGYAAEARVQVYATTCDRRALERRPPGGIPARRSAGEKTAPGRSGVHHQTSGTARTKAVQATRGSRDYRVPLDSPGIAAQGRVRNRPIRATRTAHVAVPRRRANLPALPLVGAITRTQRRTVPARPEPGSVRNATATT